MRTTKHKNDQAIKLYSRIVAFKHKFGHPPSLREMCKLMGFNSTSVMRGYVRILESWNWVQLDGGQCRRMRLTRPTEIDVPPAIRQAATLKADQITLQRLMSEVKQ